MQQPQGARLCSLSQPWATPKMGPTRATTPETANLIGIMITVMKSVDLGTLSLNFIIWDGSTPKYDPHHRVDVDEPGPSYMGLYMGLRDLRAMSNN